MRLADKEGRRQRHRAQSPGQCLPASPQRSRRALSPAKPSCGRPGVVVTCSGPASTVAERAAITAILRRAARPHRRGLPEASLDPMGLIVSTRALAAFGAGARTMRSLKSRAASRNNNPATIRRSSRDGKDRFGTESPASRAGRTPRRGSPPWRILRSPIRSGTASTPCRHHFPVAPCPRTRQASTPPRWRRNPASTLGRSSAVSDPATLTKLMQAIIRHENGKAAPCRCPDYRCCTGGVEVGQSTPPRADRRPRAWRTWHPCRQQRSRRRPALKRGECLHPGDGGRFPSDG